jgi:two-component system chemotaxis sensor kinase CheA
MNHEHLTRTIDDIALAFVLIDPADTEELTSILEGFNRMLPWARDHEQPVLEQALLRLTSMMTDALAEETPFPDPLFDLISQSISVIQNHARLSYDFSSARFPFDGEEGTDAGASAGHDEAAVSNGDAPSPAAQAAPPGLKHPGELPGHLDMDLFAEFLSLQPPILDTMETLLLTNEKAYDLDAISRIRRLIHTQKGEAGFLNLKDVERLCHATEDMLEADPAYHDTDLLFAMVDWLRHAYGWYGGAFTQPPPPVDGLLEALDRINTRAVLGEESSKTQSVPDGGTPEDAQAPAAVSTGKPVKDSILVDTERLDRIIDMIGELVVAGSMIMQSEEIRNITSRELNRNLALMDKITRGLQEAGLSLRMVPIRSTFQKVARLVRDISKKSGKTITLTMQGEETELDKTIVDKIGEPLLHIIRNAMDHGIEKDPAQRLAQGKPAEGFIRIRAFHKSGNIQIEIEDDGRGISRDRILKKARALDLLTDEPLSDRDILNLIFEPGFSTAETVSDLSGRGVGMSVVKTTIESLRGQVDVRSEEGKGSTFAIRIPLTLAIIDGMIVRVGTNRFILPTLSIVTSTRMPSGDINTVSGTGRMVNIQNRLIPFFELNDLLGMPPVERCESSRLMVVVEGSSRRIALGVDELLGKQQIVIKSLGESMANVPGISGAAIMPDGRVGLIVDIDRLTERHQRNLT